MEFSSLGTKTKKGYWRKGVKSLSYSVSCVTCTYYLSTSFFWASLIQLVSDGHCTCLGLKASLHCNVGILKAGNSGKETVTYEDKLAANIIYLNWLVHPHRKKELQQGVYT